MSDNSSDPRSNTPDDAPFTTEPPPGSPFAPAPEEPRLSIRHLLVWGVCVAVYCSASQSIEQLGRSIPANGRVVFTANSGVIVAASNALTSGTAVAGLVLLFARRRRGLAYPHHGGEWLWTIAGITTTLGLVVGLLMSFGRSGMALLGICSVAYLVILGIAYLVAVLRCEGRRWKIVISLIPILSIASYVGIVLSFRSMPVMRMGSWVMVISVGQTVVLLAAVASAAAIDLRAPRRYPWSHWAGILLCFWKAAAAIVTSAIYATVS